MRGWDRSSYASTSRANCLVDSIFVEAGRCVELIAGKLGAHDTDNIQILGIPLFSEGGSVRVSGSQMAEANGVGGWRLDGVGGAVPGDIAQVRMDMSWRADPVAVYRGGFCSRIWPWAGSRRGGKRG